LELHIEQGPILDSDRIDIGIVTGVAAIYRGNIIVEGKMDHAGTTPMDIRKDAIIPAAEIVLAFNKNCKKNKKHLVGTIGKIEVYPNFWNVVPGKVNLGFEIRSFNEKLIKTVIGKNKRDIYQISKKNAVKIDVEYKKSSNSVQFDTNIVKKISSVCRKLNIPFKKIVSGAGHDASHMQEIAPSAMIFIPSKNGKSHCPDEWTDFENIVIGTEVLVETILELDKEK
jgi:hydantoinase/carbamoylase family amidase